MQLSTTPPTSHRPFIRGPTVTAPFRGRIAKWYVTFHLDRFGKLDEIISQWTMAYGILNRYLPAVAMIGIGTFSPVESSGYTFTRSLRHPIHPETNGYIFVNSHLILY